MTLLTQANKLIEYNHWATERFIDWIKTIPSELLETEVESSFSSINKTLSHLLQANEVYISILQARRFKLIEIETSSICDSLLQQSIDLQGHISKMTQEEIQGSKYVAVDFKALKYKGEFATYDFLVHLTNHGSYHRGQIITMSKQFPNIKKPKPMDYIFFIGVPEELLHIYLINNMTSFILLKYRSRVYKTYTKIMVNIFILNN